MSHGLPIYHIMGAGLIPWMVMSGITIALYPPREVAAVTLSPDYALSSIIHTRCSMAICVPTFLESWVSERKGVEALRVLKAIIFGGGPLKPDVGNMLLSENINIAPFYGTTEIGGVSLIFSSRPPKEGWEWMQLAPHIQPTFVPVEGNMFRLLVKQNPRHTLAVVNDFIDGVPAMDTNDLVVCHPENKTLFKIFGRFDDQITHSTGEKTNPIPIESMLVKDTLISSALVFGRLQSQLGVIITPSPHEVFDPSDKERLAEYKNKIWDTVVTTNDVVPRHSRIFKEGSVPFLISYWVLD